MKKLLATTAIVAALFAGAQGAQAAPVYTLTIAASGLTSAAQCAANFVGSSATYSAGTCTVSGVATGAGFGGGLDPEVFGDWTLNQDTVLGAPAFTQPALHFDARAATDLIGASITITATVQNYTMPLGPFDILATGSGTVADGMNEVVNAYYDPTNSGVAGVGINLESANWTGFDSGSIPSILTTSLHTGVDALAPYTLSWTDTITRIGPVGDSDEADVAGTLKGVAVPSPTPLSLLGFGLVALALVTRRRGFQN